MHTLIKRSVLVVELAHKNVQRKQSYKEKNTIILGIHVTNTKTPLEIMRKA